MQRFAEEKKIGYAHRRKPSVLIFRSQIIWLDIVLEATPYPYPRKYTLAQRERE